MCAVNTKWFQDRIEDRKLSQRKLAAMMGLDPASVSMMLNGKRSIKMAEAASLSSLLGVPLDDVMFNAGLPKPRDVDSTSPITMVVDGVGRVKPREGVSPRVPVPPGLPTMAAALRCEDPTSAFDGWVFFAALRSDVPAEAIGRLCLVRTAEGNEWVRFVRRGYSSGLYTLASLTGEAVPDMRLVTASPILWIAT